MVCTLLTPCSRTLLRKCPKSLQPHYLERISNIRQHLHAWWLALPESIKGNNTSAGEPLSRNDVHLKLCFHLNDIFMGRPFIILDTKGYSPKYTTPPSNDNQITAKTIASRSTLATGAVSAALEVIQLCQSLQENVGLSRASYIEFSAARAALLVILAQSFNEHSDRLRNALKTGMTLIRCMATDIDSAKSEVSVIESLEMAVKKMDLSDKEMKMCEDGQSQYGRFRSWAATLDQTTDGNKDIGNVDPGAHNMFGSTIFDELRVGTGAETGLERDLALKFDDLLEYGWQDTAGWFDESEIGVEFDDWH